MNVEIGAEAALFPEKEYINGIFFAVYSRRDGKHLLTERLVTHKRMGYTYCKDDIMAYALCIFILFGLNLGLLKCLQSSVLTANRSPKLF
jgi:hypothetical protein